MVNPDRNTASDLEALYRTMNASPPIDHSKYQEDPFTGETVATTEPPRTLTGAAPENYWDLSLEEVIQIALANSSVFRDLGGAVLRAPDLVETPLDPSIQTTDPQHGVDAALSQFDPTFSGNLLIDNNDRFLNHQIINASDPATRGQFKQDLGGLNLQLAKTTGIGTIFSVGHHIGYDRSNDPLNFFRTDLRMADAWDTWIDLQVKQPLLQGYGAMYNRIAGPNGSPGVNRGVVVARVNTDISQAAFNLGLRNFVSNLENAYWELYFTYRQLDARINARDASLKTWRKIQAVEFEDAPIDASREAQAREQYFRFEQDVQNSLAGRLVNGTQSYNGSSGGTFLGVGGIQVAERRLRLLMGLPITDESFIRPSDPPPEVQLIFDWQNCLVEGITRRSELHRQRNKVKLRELELIASKNHLLPKLDLVARHRFRGFGQNLLDSDNSSTLSSAYGNMYDGHYQETQLGLELTLPTGFRQATSAVRNAQLQLARERSILLAQEQQIAHDISNAYADVIRSYETMRTGYNRRAAAIEQLEILRKRLQENIFINLDQLFNAERTAADADSNFHRNTVEYAIAIKNLNLEMGMLLNEHCIHFSGSPDVSSSSDSPTLSKLKNRKKIRYAMDEISKHGRLMLNPTKKDEKGDSELNMEETSSDPEKEVSVLNPPSTDAGSSSQ